MTDMIDTIVIEDSYKQYRKFHDKLEAMAKEMAPIELDIDPAKGERMCWCYVSKWHAFERGGEPGVRYIDMDLSVRISVGEDSERPGVGYSERYNHNYVEPNFVRITIPEEWLWTDGWKEEYRKRHLKQEYSRAIRDYLDEHRYVNKIREETLPKAEKSKAAARDKMARLKLEAFKAGVIEEELNEIVAWESDNVKLRG